MIREQIDNMIALAMKSGQYNKLKVLRLIKAEYQKYETAARDNYLDDAIEIKILKKMQKQWKEELDAFVNAGRDAFDLKLELEYLESFIPKEMSEQEKIDAATFVIEKYLKELPIEDRASMKHLGAIMKIINKEYAGIEGKLVADLYKKIIEL